MAGVILLCFVGVLFAGSRWLPGRVVRGAAAGSGPVPEYRLNGLALFVLTVGVCVLLWWRAPQVLAYPVRHLRDLFVAANVFAFALAGILCVRGRHRQPARPRPGPWAAVKDYFFGVELNPRWGGVDLKLFSYRPSLIGLLLINFSAAGVQYVEHGSLTPRMALYQVFFFVYLANYFQFEGGMLHTWDLTSERFGWMLVWGDYVLVPFFYGLPGLVLVDVHRPLPLWLGALCCLLFVLGFWLFRGANDQKHRFKQDAKATIWGRPAETVGGRLLVSGFWGIGRKLNYTGELLVYVSWTLLCGAHSPLPYTVPVFLLVLFVHRAHRDDRRCRAKYGAVWSQYCERARFRMFPYVY
ncbi:DUF1295 domain-containing protein [Streptomyces sp. CC224B]|uniref:DUF1295 domain-containing protein n=1 Tax=Streptomyces sp. CC224B TaxID=3044571 RepID=UPI0024A8C580|nr:DUF1295 domain-containing protein [Streptomyces sp. CC224B]